MPENRPNFFGFRLDLPELSVYDGIKLANRKKEK